MKFGVGDHVYCVTYEEWRYIIWTAIVSDVSNGNYELIKECGTIVPTKTTDENTFKNRIKAIEYKKTKLKGD